MSFWNHPTRLRRSLLALAVSGAALAAAVGVVWAHEGREVHGFTFDVGFLVEPAYEGQPNGVYLSVTRADGDRVRPRSEAAATITAGWWRPRTCRWR